MVTLRAGDITIISVKKSNQKILYTCTDYSTQMLQLNRYRDLSGNCNCQTNQFNPFATVLTQPTQPTAHTTTMNKSSINTLPMCVSVVVFGGVYALLEIGVYVTLYIWMIIVLSVIKRNFYGGLLEKYCTVGTYVSSGLVKNIDNMVHDKWCPGMANVYANKDAHGGKISKNLGYCVILKHLQNINYVMDTYRDARLRFKQLNALMYCIRNVLDTNVIFPTELIEMIVSYNFGTSIICVNDLLVINKQDFIQHSYHWLCDSTTSVDSQISAFVTRTTKSWNNLIRVISIDSNQISDS